jgi:hypothetical protein
MAIGKRQLTKLLKGLPISEIAIILFKTYYENDRGRPGLLTDSTETLLRNYVSDMEPGKRAHVNTFMNVFRLCETFYLRSEHLMVRIGRDAMIVHSVLSDYLTGIIALDYLSLPGGRNSVRELTQELLNYKRDERPAQKEFETAEKALKRMKVDFHELLSIKIIVEPIDIATYCDYSSLIEYCISITSEAIETVNGRINAIRKSTNEIESELKPINLKSLTSKSKLLKDFYNTIEINIGEEWLDFFAELIGSRAVANAQSGDKNPANTLIINEIKIEGKSVVYSARPVEAQDLDESTIPDEIKPMLGPIRELEEIVQAYHQAHGIKHARVIEEVTKHD